MTYLIDGRECELENTQLLIFYDDAMFSVEPTMALDELHLLLELAAKRKKGQVTREHNLVFLVIEKLLGYEKLSFTLTEQSVNIPPSLSAVVAFHYSANCHLKVHYHVPNAIRCAFQAGLMCYLIRSAVQGLGGFMNPRAKMEIEQASTISELEQALLMLNTHHMGYKPNLPLGQYNDAITVELVGPLVQVGSDHIHKTKKDDLVLRKLSFANVTYENKEALARVARRPNKLHEAKHIVEHLNQFHVYY